MAVKKPPCLFHVRRHRSPDGAEDIGEKGNVVRGSLHCSIDRRTCWRIVKKASFFRGPLTLRMDSKVVEMTGRPNKNLTVGDGRSGHNRFPQVIARANFETIRGTQYHHGAAFGG